MEALVDLEAAGLDPSLLARDKPAETYLTRPPKNQRPDKAVLDIAQTTPSPDAGYAAFIDAAKAQEAAFDKCWDTYVSATQKPTLAVELKLKYRVQIGDDDMVVGAKLDVTTQPGLSGADGAAAACVRSALDQTVTDFPKTSKSANGWDGAITINLKPPA
jgi:hypothetical protein